MRTDDLEILRHASQAILVLDAELGGVWLNRRAEARLGGNKAVSDAALRAALAASSSLASGVCTCLGQSGPVPAAFTLDGRTVSGNLRRGGKDRVIFELEPALPVSHRFHQLTRDEHAARLALNEARRRAAVMREARDRVRLIADDILTVALEPLSTLHHAIETLGAKYRDLHQGNEVDSALFQLSEARARIGELHGLMHDGFLVDLQDVIRPRALIGRALRSRGDRRPGLAARLDMGELPTLIGNLPLAERLFRNLLDALLLPGADPSVPALRAGLQGRTENGAVVVQGVTEPCAMLDTAAMLRRDRAVEAASVFASLQGWTLQASDPESDRFELTLRGPAAADDDLWRQVQGQLSGCGGRGATGSGRAVA